MELFRFYSKQFGPYLYQEFNIAPVHLGYGGEQMSNMIFVDTRAYRSPGFLRRHFDFLIAHEAGHQWFYNLVGVNANREMWMEEGVNSYFIGQYLKDRYGPKASVIDYPSWLKRYRWLFPDLTFESMRDFRYKMMVRQGYDQPVIKDLSGFQEPSSIFSIAYGKGSRVVGMLKNEIGDEAFARVFKRVFEEFRFKTISVDQFKMICQQESKKDLDQFFDQWLYSKGAMDYALSAFKGRRAIIENKATTVYPAPVEVTYAIGSREGVV